eukprot:scaffold3348_cov113-Isochrysis_galbana.AAC.16
MSVGLAGLYRGDLRVGDIAWEREKREARRKGQGKASAHASASASVAKMAATRQAQTQRPQKTHQVLEGKGGGPPGGDDTWLVLGLGWAMAP